MRNMLISLYSNINRQFSKIALLPGQITGVYIQDEISAATTDLLISARHEVCMTFYKFFADSHAGKEIICALRDLQKSLSEKDSKEQVVVRVLLNKRGFPATVFYKKNNSTGLEELAREINNKNFKLEVRYHSTSAFGTYHF